jgi:RNA polymerase sigma factor (sigma-70 family)
MHDDRRLLREYLEGSPAALDELIRRHLGLVYSSALRQVGDAALAEDVTQAVFLILMKKAGTIRGQMAVGGWLISVTRNVAINAMKKRTTDRTNEQKAARPEAIEAAAGSWEAISPVIDAELARLPRKDRDAIVLRFFENRSFAEIGNELGMTAEAARKRVARSLVRLRARIGRRERALDAASLGAAIAAFAVRGAPHHLLGRTIAALSGNPTPAGKLLMKGALKMIAYQKAKLLATAATLAVGVAGVVVAERFIVPVGGNGAAASSRVGHDAQMTFAAPIATSDATSVEAPVAAPADDAAAQAPGKPAIDINLDDPPFSAGSGMMVARGRPAQSFGEGDESGSGSGSAGSIAIPAGGVLLGGSVDQVVVGNVVYRTTPPVENTAEPKP